MHMLRLPRTGALALLCLLLLGASLLSAEDGRPVFTGSFEFGEVTDLGDQVQVEIRVRMRSYNSYEAGNVNIVLAPIPFSTRDITGSFPAVNIPAGGHAQARGTFVLPKELYESWVQTQRIPIVLDFTELSGLTVEHWMELLFGTDPFEEES